MIVGQLWLSSLPLKRTARGALENALSHKVSNDIKPIVMHVMAEFMQSIA
jgi:hypothetical protein